MKQIALPILLALLIVPAISAQENTVPRLYLLPIVHVPLDGGGTYNCPKYLQHRFNPAISGLETVRYAWETYLLEDVGLAAAETNGAQHTLLASQLDVIALPENLDNLIQATAVARVRDYLDVMNVPANWIVSGMTFRSALRTLLNIWQLHNRYVGMVGKKLFDGTIRLNDTVADIPQRYRDDLRSAAESIGLDYSGVTTSTTIRQLFKMLADQLGDRPYTIGSVTI